MELAAAFSPLVTGYNKQYGIGPLLEIVYTSKGNGCGIEVIPPKN
jgi:hypothetical protein